ncbi:MAG: hypothetical protein AB8E15_08955 [Bdellovibrionales bacterium]
MKLILMTLSLIFMSACATSHKEKSEVKEIETELERKQEMNGETLGVKDDSIVIQRKRELAEELRDLENDVYGLDSEVYGNRKYGSKGLYGVYRDCKAELNSITTEDSPFIEPREKIIQEKNRFAKFGLDENDKLVTVSEEFISERLERYKKYQTKLEKRRDEYELKVRVCKNELKVAKRKAAQ